ncbi:MAG: hypothetical protein V4586_12870 [Pseudomonadota bacterium]
MTEHNHAPRRQAPLQPYHITTSSEDCESWPWYRDFLAMLDALRQNNWKDNARVPKRDPLPVSIGRAYCAWIMTTPEMRDVLYRRFIQRDFDNDLEKRLLKSSAMYFVMIQGYSGEYSTFLSSCWHIVTRVMLGEVSSLDADQINKRLLIDVYLWRAD